MNIFLETPDMLAPNTPGYPHTPGHDMDPQTPGQYLFEVFKLKCFVYIF